MNSDVLTIRAGKSGFTKGSSKRGNFVMRLFKNPFARKTGNNRVNPYEINRKARQLMSVREVRATVRLNVVGFAYMAFGEEAFNRLSFNYKWDFNGRNSKRVRWERVGIEFENSKKGNTQLHCLLKDSPAHREHRQIHKKSNDVKSNGVGINSFDYLTLVEMAEELDNRIPGINVTVELLVNPSKFTVEFKKQFGGVDNALAV